LKNVKNIFLIFYALIPLSAYQFSIGIGISLDRILLPLVLILVLTLRFDKVHGLLTVLFLLFSSSVFSILFSNSYEWVGFYKLGPSWFQSIIVFVFSVLVAEKFGEFWVRRIFLLNLLVLFFFACYGFWYRYILDDVNVIYPFSSYLPDLLDNKHKWTMLYHKRLFFPFSSAPRLGFVAGFLTIYYIFFSPETRRRFFFVAASLFILIVTISRGPMLSLFLSIFLVLVFTNFYRGRFFPLLISTIFISVLFVLIGYVDLSDSSKFERLFSLSAEDESLQGHLGIRLRVLNLVFNNSVVNMFFGYGLGQTEPLLNVSSAHSSYFTQLFEQGLFGIFSYALVYLLILRNAWLLYKVKPSRRALGLFVLAVYLTLIHFAYDAISMVILWAYNGLVWGLINFEKKYGEYKCRGSML